MLRFHGFVSTVQPKKPTVASSHAGAGRGRSPTRWMRSVGPGFQFCWGAGITTSVLNSPRIPCSCDTDIPRRFKSFANG